MTAEEFARQIFDDFTITLELESYGDLSRKSATFDVEDVRDFPRYGEIW